VADEIISDNVVRKIQLLLQLAERAKGNETEAAAAMGKAQELLAKYNLDLTTVQDKVVAGGTNTPDDAMAKRDYAKVSRSAMYQWQRKLVKAIAEANYCKHWVEEVYEEKYIPPSKRKYGTEDEAKQEIKVKRHKLLGRTANTMTVLLMVDYIMDTIERLLPYPQAERLSRSANSWREGCSDRLIERIQEKAEAMKTADYASQGEAAYSTAIAVRNMATAEEIGNYDFLNGHGAWARKLARQAESAAYWERAALAREEREQKELAELEAKLALETPEQKARREKKEVKDAERRQASNERYWDRQDRKADREAARRDHSAYNHGSRTAEKIGLDAQLKTGKKTESLG
jgi:hypothetical protein